MSARILLSVVLLGFASTLSTRDAGHTTDAPRLDFEFAGCARVRPGPVCELSPDDRVLSFWVPGSVRVELEAAARGRNDIRVARSVEGGWQLKFRVPEAARAVRLRAGDRRGELLVSESSEPAALRELARLWKAGEWERVRAALETANLPGAERERLRAFRARLALRAGDNQRAATELEQSANSALEAGLLLEASNDLFAAAYCLSVRLGDYERARTLLERVERELAQLPEAQARLAYYSGVLAKATGDVQGALVRFRKASVHSRRLDLVSDELLARQELALTLNRLERHGEALAEQETVVEREVDGPSCLHSLRWENLAWVLLSQPDPGLRQRAAAALDRAEGLYERCPDPLSRRNQRLNRVQLALLRGDTADAEARLQALEADATGRSTRLAAWQALYLGELFLLRGDNHAALTAFEQSARLADGIQLTDCAHSAKLGRARALARSNDSEAVAAYLEAEDAADVLVRSAPFGQGQQLTALRLQEGSRELLSLLLERGQVAQAHGLAVRVSRRLWASNFRASRIAASSGALRARWERAVSDYQARRRELEQAASEDWKLSLEGLRAIGLSRALERQRLENALAKAYAVLSHEGGAGEIVPKAEPSELAGELYLLLSQASESTWLFLSRGDALPRAARVSLGSSRRDVEQGLSRVLESYQQQGLLSAKLLRVSLPPELSMLDVHALEIGGRPLAEHVPVAYGFEPGVLREQPTRDERALLALVLGDPNRDLSWAETEAARVVRRFSRSLVLSGEQVTFDAVSRHAPDAQLLHFAGHALSGGLDGLEGALRLNAGQRLSLGDVFALRRVPEFVVLSACTSSVSAGSGNGLSIGQAFIAAGSRAVIGASRGVSDRLAQRFMQAFYDALIGSHSTASLPSGSAAWGAAVRAAGLHVKRTDPSADWASMRLLLP